jgi:glucose-1-phosphate thymidylyltransferase
MKNRKGILLAGGSGSRLHPVTKIVSKQILPLYDKPMIYYSMSVLMMAGIKDIMIISTPRDIIFFKNLFGSGKNLGINLSYAIQEKPKGIAQALIIADDFVGKSSMALMLGDNFFYGNNLEEILITSSKKNISTIFAYEVKDPTRYGIISCNKNGIPNKISEKPKKPDSNYAVTGLYFFENEAIKVAKSLKPSTRGELEITDVNKFFLKKKKLNVQYLSRGFAWLDTGTFESFFEASQLIRTIENRQGIKIGCLEEISLNKGWIKDSDFKLIIKSLGKSTYGDYLKKISSKK